MDPQHAGGRSDVFALLAADAALDHERRAEPCRRVAADRPGQPEESRSRSARRSPTACSSPRNDAKVVAHSRATAASTRDLPLDWAIDRDGEYRGTFTPDQAGDLHGPRRRDASERRRPSATRPIVRVADLNTEYFDAEMRAPLLKRIATETGGRFYTPATATTLAEDVAMSKHGVTVVNQMDLWDMPAIFLLLVVLVTRRVGVPQSAGAGMTGGPADRRTGGARDGSALASLAAARVAPRSLYAQTHLVIVSGLGRREEVRRFVHADRRRRWPTRRTSASAFPTPRFIWFGEDSVSKKPHYRGQSTKVNVERAIVAARGARGRRRSDRARPHRPRKRRRPETPRSAFPGPTSARGTSRSCLAKFTTQKVAFIDLTSASGDMLPVVSRAESRRHHGDEERVRAKRVAVRAVLRRRADQGRRRRRQGRARLAARGVPLRGGRDEARLRDRHEAADGARAARRHGREDGRRPTPTVGPAQGLLARRFFLDGGISTHGRRMIRSSRRCTRTSSRVEDQIDQLRSEEGVDDGRRLRRRARGAARAARRASRRRFARWKGGRSG